MITYENAPESVLEQIAALLEAYHPALTEAGVTIHALFAKNPGGHAVSCGGYPALAVVRITSLKDRVKGMKDAEIVIDAELYEGLSTEEQAGLLDHELFHLEGLTDAEGCYQYDAHERPKLALRKHDVQVGWFREIAKRHGPHSPEQVQARFIVERDGRYFFASAELPA